MRSYIEAYKKSGLKEFLERTASNTERCLSIFSASIEEGVGNATQVALEKINNGKFEPQDAKRFKEALSKSKHEKMLTDYSESELNNMKLFKVEDLDIGFALKKSEQTGKHDEIVAVFNNEPSVSGVGNDLMKQAIRQGGCFLDHFDGYLSSFYEKLGFVEYKRDEFDPQYDKDGSFRNKYGDSDVIYRKHTNCSL